MFHLRLSNRYRLWLVVCLGFIALAITFAGQSSLSRAENVAALSVNTSTSSQNDSGKPVAGPPAVRRVVDLRVLPFAEKAAGKTLPFRFPRGTDALIASQQEALKTPPSDALKDLFSPLAFGAPTIITGFNGINSEESGGAGGPCFCVPPDGDMSAGPNHVIVGVNQAFRIFNKTGTPLTAPIGFDTFFGSCGASGLTSSDPITAYDPVANRFTVGILRYADSNGPSWISLAVSQSPDPTTTWNQYCFEQRYQDLQALYDFPHISVGQTALFTTGNLFPPGGVQQISARVNAFNKQQMYSGAITVTQVYSDVLLNSDLTQADTLRPALFNVGLPSPTNYFINTSPAPSTRSTLWRWTDPFGTNVFVQAGGVDMAPFVQALPMLQPPPGQPMPPAGYIDTRTLGAMWHNGTLYATHAIGCNPGASATDCVQWWQVGNLNGPPTLIQQGIVGADNQSRAYPNLAVDSLGNVRLSYAYSSLTDFIGLRHTGRLSSDALGTMGPEGVIKAGEQAEVGYNALRWGDYSGSVTDPDGLTLWHFEEYSQAINDPFGSWGTWASSARFPAQGTPTATVTGTPPTATRTSTAPAASATAIATATTTASATATQCASTSTGSILATDPTQTNRLFRDGVASTCAIPKACPTLNDPVGLPRHYDSYTYTNNTGTQACITVWLDPMLCNTPANNLFSAAYVTSFNPSNLCQNYLADIGGSPSVPSSYSFIVPAGATFVVVVHEVNPDVGCPAYGITVTGLSCTTPTPTVTGTNTPILPSATLTLVPPTVTRTSTAVAPTSTSTTIIIPTSTVTRTGTPFGPSPTITLPLPTPSRTLDVPTGTATATIVPPSSTSTVTTQPTFTAIPPTFTVVPPSATRTSTPLPTQTPGGPTATTQPTSTRTSTTAPTQTSLATNTRLPTQTPGGPTATIMPSSTPVPPTSTIAPTSTPTTCPFQFTDVPPQQTFYTFIRCLACRGIMSGYQCGGEGEPCDPQNHAYFRPGNEITRGQIAKIVSNSAGFSEDAGAQIYEDVPPGSTFYVWINRLSHRGHMGGYRCGLVPEEPCVAPDNRPYFRTFANATRGQLSKIVSNAGGIGGTPTGVFYTDVQPDNPFYVWIMRLTNLGVMSGYQCGGPGEPCDSENRPYFRPFNNVTRGQASKIVANTFYPNCQTPFR